MRAARRSAVRRCLPIALGLAACASGQTDARPHGTRARVDSPVQRSVSAKSSATSVPGALSFHANTPISTASGGTTPLTA